MDGSVQLRREACPIALQRVSPTFRGSRKLQDGGGVLFASCFPEVLGSVLPVCVSLVAVFAFGHLSPLFPLVEV